MYRKSSPKWTQILENRAPELSWNALGTLQAPRWLKIDTKKQNSYKINNFRGGPMGSKMEPKSIKNLMKIGFDFYNDFQIVFSRSWIDFGSKNLSKMRGRRGTFSTKLRIYKKCDFEQPSNGFAIFFHFGSNDFLCQR